MIVHFVCEGNVFRSRLAEAYLRSKRVPNLTVFSSGIIADLNSRGPISWLAQRIIQLNNLVPFGSANWQKTTKELLEKGDLTIFMTKKIYDFCVQNLGYGSPNYQIWDIDDLSKEELEDNEKSTEGEQKAIEFTERVYQSLKDKIDNLVADLT
jgi:protein-tyrosine-phosphatase